MNRRLFVRAAAATLATVSQASPAAALRPLKIGYVPSTLFAPVFVAIDRGMYADEGFDVQPVAILAGQDAQSLLALGTLDVAASGLSAAFYNAVSRGLDVKYVASIAHQPKAKPASALMVRQDLWDGGDVRTIAALRGRSIAWIGGLGATATYYVDRILRPGGLGVKDLRVINLSLADAAAALTNKGIDAVFTNSPFTDDFADQHLAHTLGAPPPGISGTGLFYGANLLKDRDAGRRVIRATRKAAVAIAGRSYELAENIDIIAKYANAPPDLIQRSARYDIDATLAIDTPTLLDIQQLFATLGVLSYTALLTTPALTAHYN